MTVTTRLIRYCGVGSQSQFRAPAYDSSGYLRTHQAIASFPQHLCLAENVVPQPIKGRALDRQPRRILLLKIVEAGERGCENVALEFILQDLSHVLLTENVGELVKNSKQLVVAGSEDRDLQNMDQQT